MGSRIALLIATLMIGLFAKSSFAEISFLQSITQQERIETGRKGYHNRCSGCHGVKGDGQGPGSLMLDPKPRDFTSGVFKFKQAALGKMPSDDDLMRVLNRGILGTSMPSFRLVSDDEKRAIIEYIKTFAPEAWQARRPEDSIPPLPIPADVFMKKEDFLTYAEKGRVWFQALGCTTCHGIEGQGDGPSAAGLVDMWQHKIPPANLRKPYIKRGDTIEDVAYSIYQGVDGSPMPAHGDMLAHVEEQYSEIREKRYIWELAAYIFYLRGEEAGLYQAGVIPPIPIGGLPLEEIKATVGKYLGMGE